MAFCGVCRGTNSLLLLAPAQKPLICTSLPLSPRNGTPGWREVRSSLGRRVSLHRAGQIAGRRRCSQCRAVLTSYEDDNDTGRLVSVINDGREVDYSAS